MSNIPVLLRSDWLAGVGHVSVTGQRFSRCLKSPKQAFKHLRALPCAVADIDRLLRHCFMTYRGILQHINLQSWDSLRCTNHASATSVQQSSQESAELQLSECAGLFILGPQLKLPGDEEDKSEGVVINKRTLSQSRPPVS